MIYGLGVGSGWDPRALCDIARHAIDFWEELGGKAAPPTFPVGSVISC